MKDDDPDKCGDVYTLTAMKSDTRLLLIHHENGRTSEDATKLFEIVKAMSSKSSPIPVFTSDNWNPFEEGLLNTYGILEVPPYKGIGRKPLPRTIPPDDLKYVKIIKKKVKNIVVKAVQRVVFGKKEEVEEMLGIDEDDYIGTSYVERINLTIRNSLARFILKGINFSKNVRMHKKALDLFQAWYNFVKPHDSLKIEVNSESLRWEHRTPSMAEELTDHIWTLEELFEFKVPVI
ncbi:MAG: hypothetical protein PHV51_01305 [Methanosarcinaceae archaeon]|nr:hypothetical protein [Methanosarcinaceae archaeon]